MQGRNPLLVLAVASLLTASACGSTAVEPTATPEPTNTPKPTDTPIRTDTPVPTDTPIPTDTPTPRPTNTPRPTDTPRPTATATPLPEVETYTGSGTSIVDVGRDGSAAIVHIVGNSAGRYFCVESYDENGEQMELLVNTTEPYDGYSPLDWRDDEATYRFAVEAVGQWTIEILPFAPIPETVEHCLAVPGKYEGSGDDVVILMGETPDTATIVGNDSASYFGVLGYTSSGGDLLVNTTDPFEGTKMLDRDTFALEVDAKGSWSIEVTSAD